MGRWPCAGGGGGGRAPEKERMASHRRRRGPRRAGGEDGRTWEEAGAAAHGDDSGEDLQGRRGSAEGTAREEEGGEGRSGVDLERRRRGKVRRGGMGSGEAKGRRSRPDRVLPDLPGSGTRGSGAWARASGSRAHMGFGGLRSGPHRLEVEEARWGRRGGAQGEVEGDGAVAADL